MAICGSCGMMLERHAEARVRDASCATTARARCASSRSTHFPIVRDLVVDQSATSWRSSESIKPYLIPKAPGALGEGPNTCRRRSSWTQYYQYSQCINCLLCYAACPQYGLNPTFTGPAALALLHRYNADSRDGGKAERMEVVNAEDGVWGCTLVGYCSEVCPKGVDPARAVNQNKIESTKDYFLRFLKAAK